MTSSIDNEYKDLSKKLFNINVICENASDVSTNFDDMKNFDWTKLNFNIIKGCKGYKDYKGYKGYKGIYNVFMKYIHHKSIVFKNTNLKCVAPLIQLFLSENYIFIQKNIILAWVNEYRHQLQSIYIEDKFDLSWYDFSSSDYEWARTRIENIDKINKNINTYLERI